MTTKRERLDQAHGYLRNLAAERRGRAIPALTFGEQRSGTNMMLDWFRRSPRTAARNETEGPAFAAHERRDPSDIAALVRRFPASQAVLEPAADVQRASETVDARPGARAVCLLLDHITMVVTQLLRAISEARERPPNWLIRECLSFRPRWIVGGMSCR